jgi:ribosome-binding factor A
MNRRLQRLNGLFQEELAELTRDLRDPRLASIVSITRVDVSPDLEKAVVHVSVLGTDDEKRDSIAALAHAAPFLRRELLRRMRIRKVPALNFLIDETIEEAAHVLELMRQVIPAQPAPAPKQADD